MSKMNNINGEHGIISEIKLKKYLIRLFLVILLLEARER